jgi:GT2 family glycosyltransferase
MAFRNIVEGGSFYIYVVNSEIWHKVGASSGEEEVSEFSAYWMMRNRVRFVFLKLSLLKKSTYILFILSTRLLKYPIFCLRDRKRIIWAQFKGFLHGIALWK